MIIKQFFEPIRLSLYIKIDLFVILSSTSMEYNLIILPEDLLFTEEEELALEISSFCLSNAYKITLSEIHYLADKIKLKLLNSGGFCLEVLLVEDNKQKISFLKINQVFECSDIKELPEGGYHVKGTFS